MLRAQCLDKLLVWFLLAVLVQHTHVGLAAVEGLGGFTETTGETVMDECVLEDTLQGLLDGHLTFSGGGIGGDLDLLGGFDLRDLVVGGERLVSELMDTVIDGRITSSPASDCWIISYKKFLIEKSRGKFPNIPYWGVLCDCVYRE